MTQVDSIPKRKRTRVWAFLAVWSLCVTAAGAEGLYLEAQPGSVHIGDSVRVSLRSRDAGFDAASVADIAFDLDPALWHLDAAWHRDPTQGDAAPWRATLRPFALGRQALPPVRVALREDDDRGDRTERMAEGTTITVLSIRADADPGVAAVGLPSARRPDDDGDGDPMALLGKLIGLRLPVFLPREWTPLLGWLAAVAVVAAALTAWFVWRRRRATAETAPVEPPLPPGLWALREIERRRRLPICRIGPPKAVFTSASQLIRLYLVRRWGVDAIEMTTLECLWALESHGVESDLCHAVRVFLEECDAVKFAKAEPPRERWTTVWDDARLIVSRSTPPHELAPDAPDADEEAAA